MVDWNKIGEFERHPKMNDELKNVGDKAVVKFLDDGKTIGADVLASSLKAKGIKGVKAKDTEVFVVEHKGEKKELWLSSTAFSPLAQLKVVRNENGDTLVGAKVRIERVSKDNPETASFSFEKA